ncbi:MAG: class D beta-lactamase [Bacteroidetes bacterium]|nr:class D beta-lactamase [Bacteroidota bacterium]MBU1720840.1 class D beta-lactamase [Bacteroidota bacterium]
MKAGKLTVHSLIMIVFCLAACKQKPVMEIRDDFAKFYEKFRVSGSFVFYDQNNDKYTFYNQSQYTEEFIPASTFKICNSLIGLETGVISDENFVIPWDSVERQLPVWNKDHDLKTAFRNSTVWYYQELARRVGAEKMKLWLDSVGYGNADISGGIDQFWLIGGLRITPEQQIGFLRRLHDNQLPFSQRNIDIVKKIMIIEETPDYILRGKTGWGSKTNTDTGWFVGYIEKGDNVYYFANCVQTSDFDNSDFVTSRTGIVDLVFTETGLWNK